jgi:2-succinyl-5-enolpyruvyl-6-hydroxy-3-cyclohexene-1-carboxylate synthase
MYSNKENVNILTSLLVAHGIRHAVVCPGSRNAPIVHNLNECPDIECYPVTDERSAGFYALGMTQALNQPVVVCVTSGTALLNLAPAVAEAYYQHRPLTVISADRPSQWIDQLDGQTLPQPDALGRFVRKAVTLPEPYNEEIRWYCNRLVNEVLIEKHAPVHINVPITEPLFDFSVPQLPQERMIDFTPADATNITLSHVCRMFMQAKRPMLIAGQPMNPLMDEAVVQIGDDDDYIPDFVLYTGGAIVSKRLKHFLRKAKESWVVNHEGEVTDTFMNLTHVVQGNPEIVADLIRFNLEEMPHPFVQKWEALLNRIRQQVDTFEPPYSQMAVVKYFELKRGTDTVHYANSMAIRLANIYSKTPVYCNRGVNGIEGSLSTAAGFSIVAHLRTPAPSHSHTPLTFCVIGDLSFFYDQNALWNRNLRGNLRVLLMNNGKGGIFNMLPGLGQSPARDRFVAAEHQTTAEGICRQNNVLYCKACNQEQMQQGIDWLVTTESEHPLLLEVLTNAAEDERVHKAYFSIFK